MQTEDNELTERAHEWIDGVHEHFVGTPAAHEPGRRVRLQVSVTVQRAGLEALERLLPVQVRPAVADAAAGGLVGGGVDRAEAVLVVGVVQRRLEEGVLEPLAVLGEQLEHAPLALLAADRLGVLGPLDLALVVGRRRLRRRTAARGRGRRRP